MSASRWRARLGLIPAHAGKTSSDSSSARSEKAHPRSRGENPATSRVSPCSEGSSPLTRGKHCFGCCGRGGGRLIPAHAGKTSAILLRRLTPRAHPRSRGENGVALGNTLASAGSSPLTRGKLVHGKGGKARIGLIPAHAGKTTSGQCYLPASWAHPRSRGENGVGVETDDVVAGSSPLTRGKPRGRFELPDLLRLIPAHAGKTIRA